MNHVSFVASVLKHGKRQDSTRIQVQQTGKRALRIEIITWENSLQKSKRPNDDVIRKKPKIISTFQSTIATMREVAEPLTETARVCVRGGRIQSTRIIDLRIERQAALAMEFEM
jgi:hypothetical protein